MLETNELTQKLRTLLHPRAALIAYSGEKDNSYASDNNYFVEIRDIDDNGMMGEGRPVTVDFMNELVRGYSETTAPRHTEGFRPICCGATRARATRGISGTIPHRNG